VNNNVAVSKLPSAVQVASPLPEYPSLHATATASVVVLVPVPPLVLSLLLFATSIEAQVAAAQGVNAANVAVGLPTSAVQVA